MTGLEGAALLDETEDFARKRDGAAPLVGRGAVTVVPGARHRLTVSIRSEPWHGA